MSSEHHHVGLVVDRTFGERISELASAFHVWVVASPMNTPIIERCWDRRGTAPRTAPRSTGMTSFAASADESASALAARIAGEIDGHHGEFAHDPPWSEIHVYGAPLDSELEAIFRELGGTHFELTKDGFVCRR